MNVNVCCPAVSACAPRTLLPCSVGHTGRSTGRSAQILQCICDQARRLQQVSGKFIMKSSVQSYSINCCCICFCFYRPVASVNLTAAEAFVDATVRFTDTCKTICLQYLNVVNKYWSLKGLYTVKFLILACPMCYINNSKNVFAVISMA